MSSENIRFDNRGRPIKVEQPINQLYESIEFTIANGLTNYDVAAQQSTAFKNFPSWTSCYIRTDQNITIKLNSTNNHAITINQYESPFQLKVDIEITNVYITNNSGSTASIKILAFNRAHGHA